MLHCSETGVCHAATNQLGTSVRGSLSQSDRGKTAQRDWKAMARMGRHKGWLLAGPAAVIAATCLAGLPLSRSATAEPVPAPVSSQPVMPADRKHMLQQYCGACHNDKLKTAGWSVTPLDPENLG